MDIDALRQSHKDQWERLGKLASKRILSAKETDELISLYGQVGQQLSAVRSQAPDPDAIVELSRLLSRARGRIGYHQNARATNVRRFVTVTMPMGLYKARWFSIGVMVASLAVSLICALYLLNNMTVFDLLVPPATRRSIAQSQFVGYYSQYAHSEFASQVWTNNARVAAISIISGLTGFFPILVQWQNALNVGLMGAVMSEQGELGKFFAYISPHGLLELSCVFMSGGVGLRLFWTMLVPGRRTRGQALAQEGRVLVSAVISLTAALAVAGALEGFVTPSDLPLWIKITLGASAAVGLWAYTFILGCRAALQGDDGDLDPSQIGAYAAQA